MKKVETYLQTAPISPLAIEYPREIARIYAAAGYKAVIVTNRYDADVLAKLKQTVGGVDALELWLTSFRELSKYGERAGFDVWLGAEVTVSKTRFGQLEQTDYLLYGIDEKFITDNARMYEYTAEQLYAAVRGVGGMVFEAHLFKDTCDIRRMTAVDGIAVTGDDCSFELSAAATKQGVLVMSGSEFHMRGDESKGGMLVDDSVRTYADFLDAVKDGKARAIDSGF